MWLIARLETEGGIWYSSHCGLDCNALEISSIDRSGKDSSDFPIIDNCGFSKEITLQLPIKIQALCSYYDRYSVQRYIPSICFDLEDLGSIVHWGLIKWSNKDPWKSLPRTPTHKHDINQWCTRLLAQCNALLVHISAYMNALCKCVSMTCQSIATHCQLVGPSWQL